MRTAHTHNCPNCEKEFQGRLNQKFCSAECKADYNNRKARERKSEFVDNPILIRNYKILKALYPLSQGKESLDINELVKKGFDFTRMTKKIKTGRNGHECYFVHSIAYRPTNKNTRIIIYNNEDLKDL